MTDLLVPDSNSDTDAVTPVLQAVRRLSSEKVLSSDSSDSDAV